ncbi:hypothetical protein LTR47_011592 [Exophiala xenobiotica]|nr:hypothetical protein LTR41_010626 [Exophiala xenobiotica]KAK5219275.1 hypothetical protein LTR47_011592 [Exophiala xenobiotica]KAK5251323.1 hypothetical protein LTS06_004080 [Exophiala xenobiotica]KAK5259619.1 hypothetical protein LTR40_005623 [Exophiala xenobiotica]KAK5350809.1 hypothetical protein LTR61_006007 [Exophiala xenobiotica]
MVGDIDYVEAHLAGLRSMVQLRGGIGSLQLSGYLKKLLIFSETISRCVLDAARNQPTNIALKPELHYPKHPFTPQLCDLISRLPQGFAEVALTGLLSVEVVEALTVFESNFSLSSTAIELMRAPLLDDLTPLETSICFALSRYRQRIASRQRDTNIIVQRYLQVVANAQSMSAGAITGFSESFSQSLKMHRYQGVIVDCLAWIVVVAAATSKADKPDHIFDSLFDSFFCTAGSAWDWPRLEAVLMHFFYEKTLIARGKQLWDRLRS